MHQTMQQLFKMICHHYKCVFIHIPKCGGQSIAHVFLNALDLDWTTRAPLLIRTNNRPELGPPRLAHLKATEYVEYKYLTQEMFDGYFKFAFVRNPWSRVVSLYKYYGFSQKLEFKSFLLGVFKDKLLDEKRWFVGPQSDFVCSADDTLMVDYIGRMENIQEDFRYVCKEIGLPSTDVPHVNKSKNRGPVFSLRPKPLAKNLLSSLRKKRIPSFNRYQDYYDTESADFVAQLYERDIRLFSYTL